MVLISGCSAYNIVTSCWCGKANFSLFVLGERKADDLAAWKGWEIKVCDGLQVNIETNHFVITLIQRRHP